MKILNLLARIRVLISKKISKILLGNVSGKIPSTVIRSIEEVLNREAIAKHVSDISEINKSTIAKYEFDSNFPLNFRREKAFDPRYRYVLKNVNVSPFSGLVWLSEGFIFEESIGSLSRLLSWGGCLHEPLLKVRIEEIETPIMACPTTGYFHWIFEILPNILFALEAFPNLKIAIPSNAPKYISEAFEFLLDKKVLTKKIIIRDEMLFIKKLVMAQIEPYSGFIHPANLMKLRNDYSQQNEEKNLVDNNFQKLYISRAKTSKRRLSNESDLELELEKLGFKIVYSEDLAFTKQVELFKNAKLIVAPHGAGLSNIVWTKSPCKVVEIFPAAIFNDCYARISISLGFDYYYVTSETDENSFGKIPINKIKQLVHKLED